MRMHSYGKCGSSNVVLGAVLVFSIIVLYNYWNVSAFNKDLLYKLHSLEQQAIALANANDAIRLNYDKSESQKTKLNSNLQDDEKTIQLLQTRISDTQKSLEKFQTENERLRKEAKKLNSEINKLKSSVELKDKELSSTKSKVVELQAQIKKLDKQLQQQKLPTASGSGNPTIKQAIDDSLQPVLMNDPAAPFPPGWTDPNYSRKHPKLRVETKVLGNEGLTYQGGPVLVFDPPQSERKKARFSVVDPPKPSSIYYRPIRIDKEQQMNPEAAGVGVPAPVPAAAAPGKSKDLLDHEHDKDNNGGEVNNNNEPEHNGGEGAGVLPVPGGNLDAAEDDGDHPMIGDHPLDDQSPDGAINHNNNDNSNVKEQSKAVGPAPPAAGANGAGAAEDNREAAHLQDLSLNNGL